MTNKKLAEHFKGMYNESKYTSPNISKEDFFKMLDDGIQKHKDELSPILTDLVVHKIQTTYDTYMDNLRNEINDLNYKNHTSEEPLYKMAAAQLTGQFQRELASESVPISYYASSLYYQDYINSGIDMKPVFQALASESNRMRRDYFSANPEDVIRGDYMRLTMHNDIPRDKELEKTLGISEYHYQFILSNQISRFATREYNSPIDIDEEHLAHYLDMHNDMYDDCQVNLGDLFYQYARCVDHPDQNLVDKFEKAGLEHDFVEAVDQHLTKSRAAERAAREPEIQIENNTYDDGPIFK